MPKKPPRRGGSILLVDAFPDERDMYAQYFGMCGFTTTMCRDPNEAIEHATRTPPDVVVTRLRQPGPLTGIDVVTRLKSHDATHSVPVVMITTSMMAADREAALLAGCDAYLLLPAMPDVLVAEIRRLLASRALATVRAAPAPAAAKTTGRRPNRRRA